MRPRILALPLAGLLLLSGCASMLERSYVSSVAHADYSVMEDSSTLEAETYQALVNSILYFVTEHSASGTIRLNNYTGDVNADLANACAEVLEEDPLGAFAVRDIRYEYTPILSNYEVSISIAYSRSAQTVDAIHSVSGVSGLRQELLRAVSSRQSQTAVRVSYFSGGVQMIEELFWQAYYSTPASVISDPEVSVALYPDTGTQRIVEVRIAWPHSKAVMENYVQELDTAAALLLDAHMDEGTHNLTAEQLILLLRAAALPDPQGESTALSALQGQPSDDTGLLLAMAYLCQQSGLDSTMVSGTLNGQPCRWMIVAEGDGYRHLLPQELHPSDEGLPPALLTDEQLSALGYTWSDWLYPACSDYADAQADG